MENKHKHLEFIQTVITRMGGNSFFLKGWTVTLVAALFALSVEDMNDAYIVMAYFPTIIFWILDGYYLSQERRFRNLYDHVRKLDDKEIDFSMDITANMKKRKNNWFCSMFSSTVLIFYLSLVAVISLSI